MQIMFLLIMDSGQKIVKLIRTAETFFGYEMKKVHQYQSKNKKNQKKKDLEVKSKFSFFSP